MRLHYINNKIVCKIGVSDLNNILAKRITPKEHYKNLKEYANVLQKADKKFIKGFNLCLPYSVYTKEPISSQLDLLKCKKIWKNYTYISKHCIFLKNERDKNSHNKIIEHLINERDKYKGKVNAIAKKLKAL